MTDRILFKWKRHILFTQDDLTMKQTRSKSAQKFLLYRPCQKIVSDRWTDGRTDDEQCSQTRLLIITDMHF